jgi:hypothetical protein
MCRAQEAENNISQFESNDGVCRCDINDVMSSRWQCFNLPCTLNILIESGFIEDYFLYVSLSSLWACLFDAYTVLVTLALATHASEGAKLRLRSLIALNYVCRT